MSLFKDLRSKLTPKLSPGISSGGTEDRVFRTSFFVFEAALTQWEKHQDTQAPVWLNYRYPEDAERAIEELKREYKLKHLEQMGAVVTVGGPDARRMVSIIQRIRYEKKLELFLYRMAQDWRRESRTTNTADKKAPVSIKFDSPGDAKAMCQTLAKIYHITEARTDKNTLQIPLISIENFCKLFEAIHANPEAM